MKLSTLLPLFLLAAPVLAQPTVTSLVPTRNALAAPRNTNISATLSGPVVGATLKVFSSQTGGQKAGVTTVSGNVVSFNPTTDFKAGETLLATLTPGAGTAPQVWQFTAAADGPGTFGGGFDQSITAYPFGTTLVNIAAGDLTNDGNIDVAVGEIGTNSSSLYSNPGTGQLYRTSSSPFGASYTQRAFPPFGDVDGDGALDLITRRNTGMGAFTSIPQPAFPAGSEYGGALTDVDGDGDLDYVYTGNSLLQVAINNGAGTFSFGIAAVPIARNGLLSAGDLDSDGDMDLVNFSENNNGWLEILTNNGQGGFVGSASYTARTPWQLQMNSSVALGDVDSDGDLDIAVPYQLTMPPNFSFSVKLWLNDGQGVFTLAARSIDSNGPSVVLGDVDGDGDLDALAGGPNAGVYFNDGTGGFAARYVGPNISASGGALLADMNSDGALDIIAAQPGSTPGQPGSGQPGILAIRLNGLATSMLASTTTSVSIWPNPVQRGGSVHISNAALRPGTATTVSLSTIMGAVVRTHSGMGSAINLSTASLAPGLYLLTVQAAGEASITRRVVIE